MNDYQRLTLILTPAEMNALRKKAKDDLRNPRDQARHILRLALQGAFEQVTNKHESATPTLTGSDGGFVERQPA